MNQYPESNAEYLASLLPDSIVVKGFNVISAWTLQQSCPNDTSTQVLSKYSIYIFSDMTFLLALHCIMEDGWDKDRDLWNTH